LSAGFAISGLSSCSPLPIYTAELDNNTIRVPLSLFAEGDFHIIRPNNFEYDIGLHKQKDGSFLALLLRCTHAANQLNYTGNGFVCKVHGSTFDEQGTVTRGPAERSLATLATQLSAADVLIFIE